MSPRVVGYARGPARIDWRNVAEAFAMVAAAVAAMAALVGVAVFCLWGWLAL